MTNLASNTDNFKISEYIEFLTLSPKKGERGKYICPNCGGHNLSINKDGVKYDCYNCGDKSAIAKELYRLKHGDVKTEKKIIKPKSTKTWIYTSEGKPYIKVERKDDGTGKKSFYQSRLDNGKWIKGLNDNTVQSKADLLYLEEVKRAIASNDLILVTEGEGCVDSLRELGLTATCNIGGSGKNYQAYEVLKDYPNVVLCPDKDTPGIKHMENIESELNHKPMWLYVYPERFWHKLLNSGGIDIADLIQEKRNDDKLKNEEIKEVIMSLVGDKKEFGGSVKTEDKIVKFPSKPIDKDAIESRLSELLEKGLKPSQETLGLVEIARDNGLSVNEIKDIYRSLKDEVNKEDDKDFLQSEINEIVNIKDSDIKISDYLPPQFDTPLNLYSEIIGSNHISMLTALLPIVASLINPNTDLTLIESTDFTAKPIFFSAIVGESGTSKSPTIDLFSNGIFSLQSKANKEYQRLKQEYEEYQGEEKIPEPHPLEYYISDFTSEFVASLFNRQPNKSVLVLLDELAALIKQNNAYRGGKGSDTEKILSARDGRGIKVNRKNGDRYDTEKTSLSIVGGIQPDILRQQMGSCQDESGYWARFVYSYLPIKRAKFPDSNVKIDIKPMLLSTYEKIQALPQLNLKLDSTGSKLYEQFFNELETLKVNEPNGALRAVYSKYKRVAGEIALLLYIFDLAFNVDSVDGVLTGCQQLILPSQFMEKGINLAKRYIQEIRSIYTENQNTVNNGLSPIFAKLIELSNRKGFITARDAKASSRLLKTKSAKEIRDFFQDLTTMGYGQLKGEGNFLQWSVDGVDAVLTGVSTVCQHPQSIDIKGKNKINNLTVDVLTPKSKFSENSISVDKNKNINKETSTLENLEPETFIESAFEGADGGVNTASTLKTDNEPETLIKSGADGGVNTASTVNEKRQHFSVGDKFSFEGMLFEVLDVYPTMVRVKNLVTGEITLPDLHPLTKAINGEV